MTFCKKSRRERYEVRDDVAEMEGFEPPHALRRLSDFESEPFSHLGTSPYILAAQKARPPPRSGAPSYGTGGGDRLGNGAIISAIAPKIKDFAWAPGTLGRKKERRRRGAPKGQSLISGPSCWPSRGIPFQSHRLPQRPRIPPASSSCCPGEERHSSRNPHPAP